MRVAVRGLALALTVSLVFVTVNDHPKSVADAATKPQAVKTTTTTVKHLIALPFIKVKPVVKPVVLPPKHLVDPAIMAKWQRVAICETGGNWHMHGSIYSGALGIRNDVWVEYGGLQFAPHAGLATPEQQVLVGRRIWARAGNPEYVPDQYGCAAW